MQKLELTVDKDQKHLTIREGKALELREPNLICITGDIDTVKNFVEKRYLKEILASADEIKIEGKNYNLQQFYKETAVVTFDKDAKSISLDVDPQDYYGVKVSGQMVMSEELKPWHINEDHMFTRVDLLNLLKFTKKYFTDTVMHDKVYKAFQTLTIKGNTEINASSDNRGNKAAAFDKKLDTSGVPTIFFLVMPIYKGQTAVKFQVEICIDNSEHNLAFWFESPELKDLQETTVETIFAEQKELFADFVIVNK